MNGIGAARSFLFVPGDRGDRFAKAVASGTDVVILDLEDGVAAERKASARAAVLDWLPTHPVGIAVRINRLDTAEGQSDLQALRGVECAIVVPKAESRVDIEAASEDGARPVIALVETARGIRGLPGWTAAAGLVRLALGNADLAAELGIDPGSHPALAVARGALVLASAADRLAPPIDGVTLQLSGGGTLEADLSHARELGFGAKLCIHPAQVAPVNNAFMPTPEEVAWARRVAAVPDGASLIDGQMIDAPVARRAHNILARDVRRA